MAAATGALSMGKRSYPTSEVRGRNWENPMPKGQRPRGVTPHPRSGAAAESARLQRRRNSWEELPKSKARGGGREELPHAPMPETRGGGLEDQPHVQGVVAAWVQEGLEELSHVEGQEGRWWGDIPHPM